MPPSANAAVAWRRSRTAAAMSPGPGGGPHVRIWNGTRPMLARAPSPRLRSSSRFLARVRAGAQPAPFPRFIPPALATARAKVPAGADYVH